MAAGFDIPALIFSVAIGAASPAPAGTCEIEAYFLHPDAAGTNLRSAPRSKAPIVKTISGSREVVASISGFDDGWFRVTTLETVGGERDEILFDGVAWVHRSQLRLDVAGGRQKLRQSPRQGARIVGTVSGDAPDVELVACSGEWAKIRAGSITGWLSRGGQCSNPLTTCP